MGVNPLPTTAQEHNTLTGMINICMVERPRNAFIYLYTVKRSTTVKSGPGSNMSVHGHNTFVQFI